jgi:hypothetical protein
MMGKRLFLGAGSRGIVTATIYSLRLCDDTGPEEHDVLRFDALYSGESKSRLLQNDDFPADT